MTPFEVLESQKECDMLDDESGDDSVFREASFENNSNGKNMERKEVPDETTNTVGVKDVKDSEINHFQDSKMETTDQVVKENIAKTADDKPLPTKFQDELKEVEKVDEQSIVEFANTAKELVANVISNALTVYKNEMKVHE